MQTVSTSSVQTEQIAAQIGSHLRGGEVIELVSDLGGGKTTFVRGLGRGAGSEDTVSSPSFTLTNQYEAPGHTIYHLDFYRLNEPGIMRDELAEMLSDPQAVVVVEWAEIVENILPVDRLTIHIETTGESSRNITVNYPDSLSYMVEGL